MCLCGDACEAARSAPNSGAISTRDLPLHVARASRCNSLACSRPLQQQHGPYMLKQQAPGFCPPHLHSRRLFAPPPPTSAQTAARPAASAAAGPRVVCLICPRLGVGQQCWRRRRGRARQCNKAEDGVQPAAGFLCTGHVSQTPLSAGVSPPPPPVLPAYENESNMFCVPPRAHHASLSANISHNGKMHAKCGWEYQFIHSCDSQ
jgi:hypothetical protein